MLESDGIKLIDFDKQMKQIDQLEDLRMSIGPISSSESAKRKPKNNQLDESTILLRELDKVRRECTDLKKSKEQMQRDRLNQTFECNLAIKEENELLKEQELLRMEFIERLEKKQDQLETEVSHTK